MNQPLNPATLPVNDNVNPYAFCLDLGPEWFIQKGAMIAYYGTVQFQALTAMGSLSGMIAARFSSPLYVRDWVVAQGQGKVVLGDRGYDINSFDLEDGNLTVRASNLLAFATSLELKQSIVPGFLTLIGTGKFLASSNGPVIFVEPPIRVDPEALVGWADCPSPSHHYDTLWMQNFLGAVGSMFGRNSGEERQYDFTGAGTVLMQSSEAVKEDPALLRIIEQQSQSLSASQAGVLGQTLVARAQQSQY